MAFKSLFFLLSQLLVFSSAEETIVFINAEDVIDEVDARIFGGFIEHMGRCIYQGLWDPNSTHADANGWRQDVLGALDQLQMPIARYPGGNFASGYHWMDGIGPVENRKITRELAWRELEPNLIGTDEMLQLMEEMGWEPMVTVNLGTGTPEEARNWLEYTNMDGGTIYSDMRIKNGRFKPYDVKLWCLGNELDGPWQLGHVPAFQYTLRAQQAAKIMKDLDPTIEVVAVGSSSNGMDTYLQWDETVLDYFGTTPPEYIAIHRYTGNPQNNTANYLASLRTVDDQIEQTDAVCTFIQGKYRNQRKTHISFDEWNVWYRTTGGDHDDWELFPHIIEEVYNLEDALFDAGFLMSFIRHSDSVKVANIAQVVNVIAPLQTDGDRMLVQSIFWPFEMISSRKKGESVRAVNIGPTYNSNLGPTTYIDSASILDGNRLSVFLINRSVNDEESEEQGIENLPFNGEAEVILKVTERNIVSVESAEVLTGPHSQATNTYDDQEIVIKHPFNDHTVINGDLVVRMPALSFVAVTVVLE